jgi:hypothetical protein
MGRPLGDVFVWVDGPDGNPVGYGPGDEVPDEVAKTLGDHVWESEDGGEPPRSGKGSGKGAWSDFAASKGVEVGEGDDKDAIIAKLADAGIVEA